ncbi:glycosyltransferase family 4 protein [Rhizobium sp. KVB221]|uniref:Glycosyltransferase family 4 protein n=1 Tax=Rhizobium setariae TaxID=2801340 RepID=A0A936YRK3_9HYPH|nr:glycosyltransferase family 4 protein [Rhizobium setariae]MBL0373286.1 glycosyltransferase family 4 protein [Rhizobium setariae]
MNQLVGSLRRAATGETPTKVVIVLPALGAGGSEHVVNLVANHWVGLGFEVTIVTLEPPDARPYYSFSSAIRIVRVGVPAQRASRLKAAWLAVQRVRRIRRTIQAVRPDFVLSFLTRTNVLSLIATWGSGIPTIVSERNNPEAQPFGGVWKWLQKRLYPHAFGLVTMTEGALDYFAPHGRRKTWVIPNAVDLPQEWKNMRGGNRLTAVGRLTHQKGFDLLLEAFARIEASFPDWKLVIWGEGEDRAALEGKRRDLGLDGRVDMPGVTGRPGQWIETADVFVLSSRYEGWGIVLLEAMAAGLPVVSFNCQFGPSAMVTDGEDGLLVESGNAEALADALASVLADSDLRVRLSEAAVESAARYMPERILAQWDGVASEALANSRKKVTA